jgi:hypothetical protein
MVTDVNLEFSETLNKKQLQRNFWSNDYESHRRYFFGLCQENMLDPPKIEIVTKGNPVNRRNIVKAEFVVAPELNEALYSIKL